MSEKVETERTPGRETLAVQTADRLRDLILRGEFPGGQPLRELELCSRLGVSRVPLREALHKLEGEGLITLRPKRGAIVTELSDAEVREIAEACRLLEGHLLGLSAPRLTSTALDEASILLDELDRITDVRAWSCANWRFHVTLYSAAERPLLLDLLTSLRERAERAMLLLVAEPKRRATLNREHRAVLAALRAGDVARAQGALDAHLAGGRDEVLRLIERG
jgi:DNA-binding GntR family transcriptional regulator